MNDRDFCAILDEVEDPESSFNPLFSTPPVKTSAGADYRAGTEPRA